MFSKFFKKKTVPQRLLEHPKDLNTGDMLQMIDSFALPVELKGQTLHVTGVNTYQYEYENEYEFVLKGDNERSIFLTIEDDDGEQWANFSIKIQRQDVDELFTLDKFSDIFDLDELVTLDKIKDVDGFERWTTKRYTQTSQPSTAYYYNKDYRGQQIPKHVEEGGEPVECIDLADAEQDFAINIEVWDDGETDISLTVSRPLTDIVDLFPGN
jgi:hypothetical protein